MQLVFKLATVRNVQQLLFWLLIAIAPYAISFSPYETIYSDGLNVSHSPSDPHYVTRATLIVGGLLAAMISTYLLSIEITRALAQKNWSTKWLLVQANCGMFSIYLGWAVYPYWANGMRTAYVSRNVLIANLDPKVLMPMTWIGEVWRVGVLIALFGCLAIIALNVVYCLETRTWKQTRITASWALVAVLMIYYTPSYFEWIGD
jgi:hypothetical protein